MAAQDRTALYALIDSLLADNTTGEITPEDVRSIADAIVESGFNLVDDARLFANLPESVKSANHAITAADAGSMLIADDSGPLTFDLPAVGGSETELYFARNVGAGTLTIEGDGSEEIEGETTLVLATGESAMIWANEGKTAWRASVNRTPIAAGRELLTASRTYYVRTDGDDGNDGLADNSGGAFLTIQKAVDTVLHTIDSAGFDVTIQVGAGTRTEEVVIYGPMIGGGKFYIVGDETTPANCVMDVAGNAFSAYEGAVVDISGFQTEVASGGDKHIYVQRASLRFGAWHFAGGGIGAEVSPDGYIGGYDDFTISGAYVSFAHTPEIGGNIALGVDGAITVTLSGTPSWSEYFVGTAGGKFTCYPSTVTFSGSATGPRGYAHSNGIINCGGDDTLTYLPGDAGVTEQSGGRYLGREGDLPARNAAQLPVAASNFLSEYIILDSSSSSVGSPVSGGGSNWVKVISLGGANWIITQVLL